MVVSVTVYNNVVFNDALGNMYNIITLQRLFILVNVNFSIYEYIFLNEKL